MIRWHTGKETHRQMMSSLHPCHRTLCLCIHYILSILAEQYESHRGITRNVEATCKDLDLRVTNADAQQVINGWNALESGNVWAIKRQFSHYGSCRFKCVKKDLVTIWLALVQNLMHCKVKKQ